MGNCCPCLKKKTPEEIDIEFESFNYETQSLELKKKGNEFFGMKNYHKAIEKYSEALVKKKIKNKSTLIFHHF